MLLRKARAGSAAAYVWSHDGAVVEVPDHIGAELVDIPDAGFSEVSPGQPAQAPPGGRLTLGDEDRIRAMIGVAVDALRADMLELARTTVLTEIARLGEDRSDLTPVSVAAQTAVSAPGGPSAASPGAAGTGSPGAPEPARRSGTARR